MPSGARPRASAPGARTASAATLGRIETAAHHHRGRLAPQPIVDGLLQDLAEVRDDGARIAYGAGRGAAHRQ